MAGGCLLAADVGGTKTATAVVTCGGEVLHTAKEPTARDGPQALCDQVVAMLQEGLRVAGVRRADLLGLGVGVPAVVDASHQVVVWAPNLPGWSDVPLADLLQRRLGLPVHIEYDGHAAVLGEWWLGAGRGHQSVVMVIVGTGIGGGMILDGRLYHGADQLAGAAGWQVLATRRVEEDEARRVGHWESLAAGPAIARLAARKLQESTQPSLLRACPADALSASRVFDAARQGDAVANTIVGEVAEALGVGIANLVSVLNPEVVILGGSVGIQGDLLLAPVREVVRQSAQPVSARRVRIVTAELGERAGLLGAARAVLLARGGPAQS